MKRGLALLLCFCLLLLACACGKTPQQQPDGTSESAAAQTEPVSEAEMPQTEPAVFSLKELPDIGAYHSDEKKAYFFEDGAHSEFEPRDDYGPILPYIAENVPFREAPYYTYYEDEKEIKEKVEHRVLTYESRYGVMTRDGRIISGPLFDYCFCYTDRRGVNVWEFGITEPDDAMAYSHVLLGGDGSWRLDFSAMKMISFETGGSEGYFMVSDYVDDAALEYYSFDGERMTALEKSISVLEKDGLNAYLFSFEEDELVFKLWQQQDEDQMEEEDDYVEEDGRFLYVFTDRQGNKRFEFRPPYEISEIQGDLLLCYSFTRNILEVYDREGNLRLPAVAGYCHFDKASRTLLVYDMEEERVFVYDKDCNPVTSYSMNWDWLETAPNGSVFLDLESRIAYSAADCKEIDFGRTDIRTLETVFKEDGDATNDLFFLLETADGSYYLHNIDGSLVTAVHTPNVDVWRDTDDTLRNTYTLSVTNQYILTASEEEGWYLYDRQTGAERRLSIPPMDLVHDEGEDANNQYKIYGRYLQITHSFLSDEREDRTREELYDLETGRLLSPDLIWFESFPDAFLVTVKNEAYVLDNNGDVILKLNNNNTI